MNILKEIIAKYRTEQQAAIGDVCAWWAELPEAYLSIGTIVGEKTFETYTPDWIADIPLGSDAGRFGIRFCTEDSRPIVLSCTIEHLEEEYPELFI